MKNKLIYLFMLLLSQQVLANDLKCQSFLENGRFNDFFYCSLSDAKEIRSLEADKSISIKEMEFLKKSLPFEVGVSALKGKDSFEVEAGLEFSFLSYGQKESVSAVQTANTKLLEFEVRQKILELYTETVLKVIRLQQIYEEIEFNDEILVTFQSLKKRLEMKIGLSPDDKASLNLFHLNIATLRMEKLKQEEEIKDIEFFLKEKYDLDENVLENSLKKFFLKLPVIDEKLKNSLNVQVINERYILEQNKSNAEYRLSESQYGFSPKLGPLVKSSKESGQNEMSYGLSFSFANPFSNAKEAMDDTIRAKRTKLSTVFSSELRAANIKIDNLYKKYSSYNELLKDVGTFASLNGRNQAIRKLYLQGVISGVAMTDSQLKMIEILKNKNEFTLKSYGIYLEIVRMSGQNPGEI